VSDAHADEFFMVRRAKNACAERSHGRLGTQPEQSFQDPRMTFTVSPRDRGRAEDGLEHPASVKRIGQGLSTGSWLSSND
jgi:hypothetical protein